mgnify:CR=1 FL=1
MLLLNGDCIEEMQKLIDDGKQVDSIVTDPPYHLTSITERFGKEGSAPAQHGTDGAFARASKGFMGKEWDGGDIAFRKETWELAYKLLKPGGHLLAFSGSRTYHRMAVAIEDAGFDIRDQIMWLYGSGFPKSLNIGKAIDKKLGNDREVVGTIERGSVEKAIEKGVGYTADPANQNNKAIFGYGTETVTKGNTEWEGWGTALKPAHEPIVMARKPISEKSIADNVLKHGTGGINIDGCRIEYADENDRSGWHKTGGGGKGYQDTDTFKIRKITPEEIQERTKDGRFPANVMHDGSEEVRKIFPKTGSKGKAKHPDTNPDFRDAGKQSKEKIGIDKLSYGQTENIKRKSVNRQPRKDDKVWTNKNSGMKSLQYTIEYSDSGDASRYFYCPKVSRTERDKGLSGKKEKNSHPTVKPVELMKYLCRLVTPKGGTVLDIFMGSGSTGMAAKDEGFDFIGIEKDKEYFQIAEQRIKVTAPLSEFME